MGFLSASDVEGSLILKIRVFQLILSPDVVSLNTLYLRLCLIVFKTYCPTWNIQDSQKPVFRLRCLQKHQIALKTAVAFLSFYTEFEVSALAVRWEPLGLMHRSLLAHHPTAL